MRVSIILAVLKLIKHLVMPTDFVLLGSTLGFETQTVYPVLCGCFMQSGHTLISLTATAFLQRVLILIKARVLALD